MNAPTPHIQAAPADFAKTVLMPGDPLRAQWVAQTYLENPILVNNVRGVQGYTGLFEGQRVSVMASGMGMPSMAIYANELFSAFGVENIVRVGSAGAMQKEVRMRDLVIAQSASTDSGMAKDFSLPGTFAPTATFSLLRIAVEEAEKMGLSFHVGNLLSSDHFYHDETDLRPEETSLARWSKMGVLAVEMEAAALYMTAARLGKRALAICTVSDHLITGEKTTSAERETSFTDMISLSLRCALRFS